MWLLHVVTMCNWLLVKLHMLDALQKYAENRQRHSCSASEACHRLAFCKSLAFYTSLKGSVMEAKPTAIVPEDTTVSLKA